MGTQGIRAFSQFITPAIAEEYLGKMRHNRTLRQQHVDRLAKDIANGRWTDSNDAIAFNEAGELINGQHRLNAIIKAGVGAQLLVVKGLEAKAMTNLDAGAKRLPSDALHLMGETASRALARLTPTG